MRRNPPAASLARFWSSDTTLSRNRIDYTSTVRVTLPAGGCLDHRHDAGADRLRQCGPDFDHGGQVGVRFTGVVRQMFGNLPRGLTQIIVSIAIGTFGLRSHNPQV